MTGPKHLWSGDWERESARAADELDAIPAPAAAEPEQEPEPSLRRGAGRISGRALAAAAGAVLVVAAVAAAIVIALGGSSTSRHRSELTPPAAIPHTQTATGGVTPAQAAAPVTTGPSARWLGMQIVSTPLGAVISTVAIGSSGDAAGFEPGDVITAIDEHLIDSVPQIRLVTRKLALGSRVRVQVLRGSSSAVTETVTLRERPTIQP